MWFVRIPSGAFSLSTLTGFFTTHLFNSEWKIYERGKFLSVEVQL